MNSNSNNNINNHSVSNNNHPSSSTPTEQYRNLVNLISQRIQVNSSLNQLQSIPTSSMPLSSSLPSSMASSLNTNSSAIQANVQCLSSDKMDTSGPLSSTSTAVFVGDIVSRLYPNVNQQETPLPRQWSVVHKQNTLKLTLGNLRVTYTGPGKTHKDAAAIRTDYVIPPACGIYYYEVKIISKGRDGYMGIGLSKSEVQLCRLPGWDKYSYGYHGDDGHSFCCSGTGQNYGPTFTTGDVIGCCLNLIDNTCFYTKNGYNLGIAFRDLPGDLYPTVGLQTPSESVEANFGQYPFEFDIHNYVKEWHLKTRQTIERFPLKKETESNLPIILRKLISTYLVHQGYSNTAEVFSKNVGHVFEEELASIRNRQKIQMLVLNGELSKAIEMTYKLFPGILERNVNLLFALKIREFIEMIANANKVYNTNDNKLKVASSSGEQLDSKHLPFSGHTPEMIVDEQLPSKGSLLNNNGHATYRNNGIHDNAILKTQTLAEEAMDMDTPQVFLNKSSNSDFTLKSTITTNSINNINRSTSGLCTEQVSFLEFDYSNLQKILQFGRELFQMNSTIEGGDNQANNRMLRDAFSLLAYHDPWNSPLGYQLDATQREHVSTLLNSAILEANNMPRISPLEVVYGQTSECMRLMSKYGVAWCAYVNLADYMQS